MSDIEKSPIDSRMGSLSAAGSSTIASGTTLLKGDIDPENRHKNNKQGENTESTPGIILTLFSFDLPSARTCTQAASMAELIERGQPKVVRYYYPAL